MIPFFDTHVHMWDLGSTELGYEWLQAGVEYPVLGRLDRIRTPLYDAPAFHAETRFASVAGVVLVEAEAASLVQDSVLETRWFAGQAANLGVPVAIVVHTDLGDPGVKAALERHCEPGLARGVRDHTNAERLMDAAFRRGYATLASFGLVYDLDAVWQHLASARNLAESYPDITMVVEHLAFPQERTDEYFRSWRVAMSNIAAAPNVVCKMSGLGMGDPEWTADSLRPWVDHALSAFGPDRCFFGTNWPVDRMYSSYDALVDTYRHLIADLTNDEQSALMWGNAARVYRTPATVRGTAPPVSGSTPGRE